MLMPSNVQRPRRVSIAHLIKRPTVFLRAVSDIRLLGVRTRRGATAHNKQDLPAAGPYLGGTSVGVFFSPVVFEPNTPDNLFGFDEMFAAVGEGSAFANRDTLMLKPRCRFGTAVVPAVRASPAKFECTAPTAEQAGAVLSAQPATDAEVLQAMRLYGYARPVGATGAIALTGPGAGGDASLYGGAIFLRPATGVPVTSLLSIDPEVNHYKQPASPLHAVRFRCGFSFASLGIRDGFSVSYGQEPSLLHAGRFGGGEGLRVYIRPYEREVHAWLGSDHLGFGEIPLEDLQVDVLRTFELDVRQMRNYDGESSDTGVLRVYYADRLLISDAPLLNWRPLVRSEWRFGVAAQTAHEGTFGLQTTSSHTVENLTLSMGAAFYRAEVPFGVSYNGHDYYPAVPAPGVTAIADFMYGVPTVTDVRPRSGVSLTQLSVRGLLLPFGRRLDQSGGYRCKFGQIIRYPYRPNGPMATARGVTYAAWQSKFDPDLRSTEGWVEIVGGIWGNIDAEVCSSHSTQPSTHQRLTLSLSLTHTSTHTHASVLLRSSSATIQRTNTLCVTSSPA